MASKVEEVYSIADQVATIRPPRLEDAGLKDCALPLESILEAFARASVTSTGPRAIDEEDAASMDTWERDVMVVVEGSSGRKLVEGKESDSEERNNGSFDIDVNDAENKKDVRVVT